MQEILPTPSLTEWILEWLCNPPAEPPSRWTELTLAFRYQGQAPLFGTCPFFMQPNAISYRLVPEMTGKKGGTPLHIKWLSIERCFWDGYFKGAGGVIFHTEHERA